MKRLKGASMKGKGNPVRETPEHIEPDQHGSRAQRRAWAKRYGRSKPADDAPPSDAALETPEDRP